MGNCSLILIISAVLTSSTRRRATKGLGSVAPDEWQDAGDALNNEELKGCLMPAGEAKPQQKSGGYLQYNEVCQLVSLNTRGPLIVTF